MSEPGVPPRDARFVVLGNPEGRRITLFQEALAGLGLPPARVVPWLDLLSGDASLVEAVTPGAVVRIESPGRDFEVERTLLLMGAEVDDAAGFARAEPAVVQELDFERGRILWPRQWYLGFRRALDLVREQLSACPPHRLIGDPGEIAVLFDKGECHRRMGAAGVPVPRSLGAPGGWDDLVARMRDTGCRRVFVKLAHGSSASGAIAYRTDGLRHQATTTVEVVRAPDGVRLYNTRRVRTHEDVREIAALVDEVARHHVHVEEWVPKAGVAGCSFDLRVVVIAGRARHTAVRLSRSPMTNLHLLNQKGDVDDVVARAGAGRWAEMRRTCERAAALFPGCLHCGVDVMFASDWRRHVVLEANAFGDLLPGVTHDGADTYTAEVEAALASGTNNDD